MHMDLMYLLPAIVFGVGIYLYRRRYPDGGGPKVQLTIDVPLRWYRVAQTPVLYFPIATLTGVSITFCPLFLLILGGSLNNLADWRVVACLVTTYLVPLFYMRLAGPVVQHAWQNRRQAPTESGNAP